ncbi:glycine-rich RNA-binding protein 4, mitochondrial-like isoform X4 [Rhodamnia argentea]|uniref:Glycine-rich RNA-binding protein 4, mitochondrial-like isoform X4 n=1 Tax=Rhodamnia argentea TaxID=178133 RepID=A0ABM3HUS2_9MYRT|nr:glycine-rich RNA-binding protein 4, mitochondrial-like isoform X4 [Rhodamnia argentea]
MQGLAARIARRSRASPLAGGILSRGSCTKLFVGGMSGDRCERHVFSSHGGLNFVEVTKLMVSAVKVICDHVSGKSKGYGFVQFEREAAASTALKEMDGKSLDGRDIRVQYAQKRNGGLS